MSQIAHNSQIIRLCIKQIHTNITKAILFVFSLKYVRKYCSIVCITISFLYKPAEVHLIT